MSQAMVIMGRHGLDNPTAAPGGVTLMSSNRVPRIRKAAVPADAFVVVRGEQQTEVARQLARQFRQRFPDWERWGLSGFYARGVPDVEDLARDRLPQHDAIIVYSASSLVNAGFDIVPTFRTPHVTISWATDLDDGLADLQRVDHDRRSNQYHE